jgi:hypothetical protein
MPAAGGWLTLCLNLRRALYKHNFPSVADRRDKWWSEKPRNVNNKFLYPYYMADNDIKYIG